MVWLDTSQLEHAFAISKPQSSVLGVVKGKGSLGLRVEAETYAALRQAIEPGWQNESAVKYQVRVAKRFILAPVSSLKDKSAMQKILDSFGWHALPIGQMGPNTWQIGASAEPPNYCLASMVH